MKCYLFRYVAPSNVYGSGTAVATGKSVKEARTILKQDPEAAALLRSCGGGFVHYATLGQVKASVRKPKVIYIDTYIE